MPFEDFFKVDGALVRELSPRFGEALQLVHAPIDVARAERQHAQYIALLKRLINSGQHVVVLAGDSKAPDCNFVEDTAIIVHAIRSAIILIPGALSRQRELVDVRETFVQGQGRHSFPLNVLELTGDARADGGDILITPWHILIGLSKRTNEEGFRQIRDMVDEKSKERNDTGFIKPQVLPIRVTAGLHLKSVISILDHNLLVICANDAGLSIKAQLEALGLVAGSTANDKLTGYYDLIEVQDQPLSNVLRINQHVVLQAGFASDDESNIRNACRRLGLEVHSLDMSELIKADGALTCGSLLWSNR